MTGRRRRSAAGKPFFEEAPSVERFPTSGKSGAEFYLWPSAGGPRRLIKVFNGSRAEHRRDAERAALALWRAEGYRVPRLMEEPAPFVARPYLVQEFIEGPTLREFLRDRSGAKEEKIAAVEAVLAQMRARHERVLAERDSRFAHPDANTGNVILADSGPVWIDIESLPEDVDPLEAASAELVKLARRVSDDLGRTCLQVIAQRALDFYRGLENVPRLFCRRTLRRRLQPLHRWRDRRRKVAQPSVPTKYDLAEFWQQALASREEAA